MKILVRDAPPRSIWALEQAGIHPLLAQLYAARGVQDPQELDDALARLLPPASMKGTAQAAQLLANAIRDDKKLCIVADYDCDGATACAVGLRGLRLLGARHVDYIVPDRVKDGYGLTAPISERVKARGADVLITVDNGIASFDGVARARALGLQVLVTDHHLPALRDGRIELPDANVIVNPNQPGCAFPSKALAGIGVMFYVLLALRAELRQRGAFAQNPEPNLASLLDLVALGTVADVVKLDRNNRILVTQGLTRMRAGHMQAGVRALFTVAGREPARAAAFDLGFMLGPRLNAAGRLADMSLGIECLTTDDAARAMNIAQELDAINRERRVIEAGMQEDAALLLDQLDAGDRASLCLFDPGWHQGVIGILAGRIREKTHRPAFAFARGGDGELKASGRSIPGLHLRDALDLVAKRHPDLLLRFGGHAAAAGLTLHETRLDEFIQAFETVCHELIAPADLTRTLETDGPLESGYYSIDAARLLQQEVWGQAFPTPVFSDTFDVVQQRLLKEKHLKLRLKKGGLLFEAIQFNFSGSAPDRIHAAFRLDINEWNGNQTVQLLLEHFEAT